MERKIPRVYKLPRCLGWGLGTLAFVTSLSIDYLRPHEPPADWSQVFAKALVWGGLCAFLSGIVGYLVFLALGGHSLYATEEEEPAEAEQEPEEVEGALEEGEPGLDATAVSPQGSLIDLVSAPETHVPEFTPHKVQEPPSELENFSAEEMARAVQAQLASRETRSAQ